MRKVGRTVGIVMTALVTVLAGLMLATDTPGSARAAAPASYTLDGRGWGHGVGMSQYGAKGAAEQGLTFRHIVNFYYPGTLVGTATGAVRVLITAETRNALVIAHRPGLSVRSVANGSSWPLTRAGATRWRITASADNATSRVWVYVGGWQLVRQIPGQAEFVASSMRVFTPSGSAIYRGRLRSAIVGGNRAVVNVLPLETYLRGVVPLEMPALWHPQAVRAQAVAARTYAAHERDTTNRGHFDVYDTTQSQVYGGVTAEHAQTDAAIRATAQEIRQYGGKPAFTQFSSSNGGWTVGGSMPYLVARADPYDPVRTWSGSITAAQIRAAWPALGAVQSVSVSARDGNGAWGGRATTVRIVGALRTIEVNGTTFRSRMGLMSTFFRVV